MRPALMARSTDDFATPVAAAAEARSKAIAAGCARQVNDSFFGIARRCGTVAAAAGGGRAGVAAVGELVVVEELLDEDGHELTVVWGQPVFTAMAGRPADG